MTSFQRWLRSVEACEEGIEWVGDKTYAETYEQLTNPCWLLWLIEIPGNFDLDTINLIYEVAEKANKGFYVDLCFIDLPVKSTKSWYGASYASHDSLDCSSPKAHRYKKVCDAIRKHLGKRPAIAALSHKKKNS